MTDNIVPLQRRPPSKPPLSTTDVLPSHGGGGHEAGHTFETERQAIAAFKVFAAERLRLLHRLYRELMRREADILDKIEDANAFRPAGTDAISDPIADLLGRPAVPEHIVSDTTASHWVKAGTTRRIDPGSVDLIRVDPQDPDKGEIRRTHLPNLAVERRQFRTVKYHPAVEGIDGRRLFDALYFPGLPADDPGAPPVVKERCEVVRRTR